MIDWCGKSHQAENLSSCSYSAFCTYTGDIGGCLDDGSDAGRHGWWVFVRWLIYLSKTCSQQHNNVIDTSRHKWLTVATMVPQLSSSLHTTITQFVGWLMYTPPPFSVISAIWSTTRPLLIPIRYLLALLSTLQSYKEWQTVSARGQCARGEARGCQLWRVLTLPKKGKL